MTIGDPELGRPTSELTRRDVARSLLTVPAPTALEALPSLRRELVASGNPLSPAFWTAAEQALADIAAGRATVGRVRRWVQASGTEPIDLFPAQGFVWPDEDERGPAAAEMHARLVAHLEQLVLDGSIDPDRLVEEETEAWTAYERLQIEWLHTPQPDRREPLWAVVDEQDDELLAEWDAADADARDALAALLADSPPRPRPDAELRAACQRLRAGLAGGAWPYDLLRAASGVDPEALPADEAELWVSLAAGAVSFCDEPPDALDDEAHAAWMTLAHPEWLGAVVTLVRGGPGTAADAASLAHHAVDFDVDDPDDHADADISGDVADDEDEAVLMAGFAPVVLLWSLLGAVDADERLTALGWWGLPDSLTRAWTPTER